MSDCASNAYDAVNYPSFPLAQTHPDRLSVLATLFGLSPAPVEHCRVLELGCGEGSNIIPMALQLPGSRFTGVDLASQPIASGQGMVESLGLRNIVLRQLDIMEIGPDWGIFDYIIAHGLYSWVPRQVRDKLMAICGANLAPDGVAYISYNTYPGGHMRQMMREMMQFHTVHVEDPARKIAHALDLVSFLEQGQTGGGTQNPALKKELEHIRAYQHHALLYHDDMAESNTPVYFQQFAEHASTHGLQFLSEADFFEMQDQLYPPEVREKLSALAGESVVIKEQYLDFLKCRRFRQTLLCRKERVLNREIGPEQIMGFSVASQARPVSPNPDLGSPALEAFRGPRGAAMQTDHALSKAAMVCLGEAWPRPMPFEELTARAHACLCRLPAAAGIHDDPEARILAGVLLGAYSAGLIELHAYVPYFVLEPGDRPTVSRLARWQIEHGRSLLSSLNHAAVKVEDPMGAALIRLLDGSRDRAALIRDLTEAVLAGNVSFPPESSAPPTRQQFAEKIARDLEPSLIALARSALLVS